MGISELSTQITMKFALVVCFAALVACEPEAKPEAEADPYLAYGYGAYPYAYGGYRTYGYGIGAYHPYAYGGYRYAGYPYAHHGYYYGKRSADAEPTAAADAYYGYYGYGARPYYGYGLGYRGYHG